MTTNPPSLKIKIVKQSHQVQSSAGNPHNTFLDQKEVQFLSSPGNYLQKLTFNIMDNIIEWYFRTLADEIYKLAFIDDKKYYKIKMFWPSEYDQQEQRKHPNSMQVEGVLDPITYYLSQFDGFEIEDYFDVIIMPKVNKQAKEIQFKFYLNSFTFFAQSEMKYSSEKSLELFIEKESKKYSVVDKEHNFDVLSELTKDLIENYVQRDQAENKQKVQLRLDSKELWRRIIPILNEETRVLLYELYKDL